MKLPALSMLSTSTSTSLCKTSSLVNCNASLPNGSPSMLLITPCPVVILAALGHEMPKIQ